MEFYGLAIGSLFVWRATHLLSAEDGPWDLMARLRRRVGSGFFGKLLDCFYCLSLWIALPVAAVLGRSAGEQFLLWFALSGAAILLERMTARPAPAEYFESKEEPDVLLRKEPHDGGAGNV